jgi:hypothetical protein
MAIWRIHVACFIPKATQTHTEYVKLTALPWQQWLREGALMLRYTDIAGLVLIVFSQGLSVLLNLAQEGGANGKA